MGNSSAFLVEPLLLSLQLGNGMCALLINDHIPTIHFLWREVFFVALNDPIGFASLQSVAKSLIYFVHYIPT